MVHAAGIASWTVRALVCGALVMGGAVAAEAAAPAATDTLILVNGDPITVADFDDMVMAAHSSFAADEQGTNMVERLLEKRVNDYLLIQDAMTAGYDQDPDFLEEMDEKSRQYAIQQFVADNLVLPAAAPADSVRAYFDRYYWRILLRRLSVRTRAEAEDLRARVVAGEDMDALARELSLDTKKPTGGLYNMLYWADLENRIRDRVRGLEAGEITEIFPYNDAFTFVRVEEVLPVHDEAYPRFERELAADVHAQLRQRAWDAWVEEQKKQVDVREDLGELAQVIADSAIVLDGAFLVDQPGTVIAITDGPVITGTKLRRAVSHQAMQNADSPFARNLEAGRQELIRGLVLTHLALAGGYDENPEVIERLDRDWEKMMIERYLDDTVAARIRFSSEEFEEFYEEHKERFRGEEEVRLDLMILDDRAQAEEAAGRLQEGADFGYIFKQYHPEQEIALGKASFIKITELSQPFRDELEDMEPGQSSNVVEMPMGFMVFKLDARRPGALAPLEAVEMDIRRAMFARKFQELLDAQLTLLRENSDIQRWPERIAAYLQPVGEGD